MSGADNTPSFSPFAVLIFSAMEGAHGITHPHFRKQENTPTPGTGLALCPKFRVEVVLWRRAATRNTRRAHAIGCLLWFSPNDCRNHVSMA